MLQCERIGDMKPEKRAEARRLRQQGWSVKDTTNTLNISKGSVSTWVRDIPLTETQRAALEARRSSRQRGVFKGSKAVAEKYRQLRLKYQQEGRVKAREQDPLHIAVCMLYWGEGSKRKDSLVLVNSDPDLLRFFIRFLTECLNVDRQAIRLRINCYLHDELSQEDVERYWLNTLALDRTALRKGSFNNQPSSSRQRGRKLTYGVAVVAVYNTQLAQHVFGAIQEYSGIDKPEWLM